ncbi:MAG: hypothetical protein RLZZ263_1426 [Cyanobacteriota bacterium]
MARIQIRSTLVSTPGRLGLLAAAGLATSTCLGLMAATPLYANPAKEPPYPTQDELRAIQLATLDCGRENNAAVCDKARTSADPLMDHPRLSAGCKDSIWAIVQNAKVANPNTYERREGLNKAASELMLFCKRQTSSVLGNSDDAKGAKKNRFGLIQNQTP